MRCGFSCTVRPLRFARSPITRAPIRVRRNVGGMGGRRMIWAPSPPSLQLYYIATLLIKRRRVSFPHPPPLSHVEIPPSSVGNNFEAPGIISIHRRGCPLSATRDEPCETLRRVRRVKYRDTLFLEVKEKVSERGRSIGDRK